MNDGTTKHGNAPATSTVHNPRPVHVAQAVAVGFSAWGAQPNKVTSSCDGGRDDRAHVAVRVGDCLTYVYDRDALTSHPDAWRAAAQHNTT
jgi:hypothetical protein